MSALHSAAFRLFRNPALHFGPEKRQLRFQRLFGRFPALRGAPGSSTGSSAASSAFLNPVQLKEIIDEIAEGVIIYDESDRVVMWNKRFDELYSETRPFRKVGVSYETLIRIGAYRGHSAKLSGNEEEWIAERLEMRRLGGGVHERKLSKGVWIKVSEHRTPSNHMLCIHTDISALKAHEAELRESRQILQDVVDAVPGIISAKDRAGRYLFVNRYQAIRYGHEPSEAIGRTSEDLVGDKQLAPTTKFNRLVFESGKALPAFEASFASFSSEVKTWLMTKAPLRNDEGDVRGVVTVALDITEHKEADRKLRRSRRLETIAGITGGLAHDFNNLLGTLAQHLDAIQQHAPKGDPKLDASIAAALGVTARASGITKRMMAFGRRQNLNPKEMDLRIFLTGVREFLTATFESGPKIRLQIEDGIARGFADPAELEIAILNLAINARDASPKGTPITLKAYNKPAAIGGDLLAGQRQVVIEVIDKGHGMSPETISRATEPFFTTKSANAGTGLGLSMVELFAQQSGGTLEIESKVDQGTCVRLILPAVNTIDHAASAASHPGNGPDSMIRLSCGDGRPGPDAPRGDSATGP